MSASWTLFIPTAVTGIVGLAGIGGAMWQAKRSREAAAADLRASLNAATENLRLSIAGEDERARRSERQHIYAEYLSAINPTLSAVRRLRAALSGHENQAEVESLWKEVRSCRTILNSNRMSLDMVASNEVIKQAIKVSAFLHKLVDQTEQGERSLEGLRPPDLVALGDAMRAHLGEPPYDQELLGIS